MLSPFAKVHGYAVSAITTGLDAAQRGIDAVGEHSAAGRRLVDMRDFYAHIMSELPAVIDRWRGGRSRVD